MGGGGGEGRGTPGPPSARANNLAPLIQEGFQMERFRKAGNLTRETEEVLFFLEKDYVDDSESILAQNPRCERCKCGAWKKDSYMARCQECLNWIQNLGF